MTGCIANQICFGNSWEVKMSESVSRRAGIIKRSLFAVGVFVLLFLIYVATRPEESIITRSAEIPGSPETVYPFVNDLHLWQSWSPWAKLDPNASAVFNGPQAGPGSQFHWSGNSQVGEGIMTVLESDPPRRVLIKVQFLKPMVGTNMTEMLLEPRDGKTKLTWTMTGKNNFVGRLFCVLMNMDKMIGGDFERGLENLSQVVAAGGPTKTSGSTPATNPSPSAGKTDPASTTAPQAKPGEKVESSPAGAGAGAGGS